jgi:hypothetical protein
MKNNEPMQPFHRMKDTGENDRVYLISDLQKEHLLMQSKHTHRQADLKSSITLYHENANEFGCGVYYTCFGSFWVVQNAITFYRI